MKEIIIHVIEHANFYEYFMASEELRTNRNRLQIDYDNVESLIGAVFGRYYENIIEILTNKTIEELCKEGYDRYKVIRLPDNVEIHSGNLDCNNGKSGFIDPADKPGIDA